MKKIISLLLILCLLAGIGLAGAEGKAPEGKPWINSNLLSNLPAERPALEDGFDMYANYALYREVLDSGAEASRSSLDRAEAAAQTQILDLCRNMTPECAEDGILKILYGLFSDMEKRNADGLAPLMARVDRVKAAESTDDLLALMQEEGFLLGEPFFSMTVQQSDADPDRADVTISKRLLLEYITDDSADVGDYVEPVQDTETPVAMLKRMQYSEEEAAALVERMKEYDDYFEMETEGWPEDTYLTLEQIRENSLPLYAQAVGMSKVKEGAIYRVLQPSEILAVNKYFTQENLDLLKAIIALSLYRFSVSYLDGETWKTEGTWMETQEPDGRLYDQLRGACVIAVDQAYLKHFCPEENRETVVALFDEYKDAMRARIEKNTWMDEATKQKSLEKLELIYVAPFTAPGGMFDCEPLLKSLQSCTTLLDAIDQCQRFFRQCVMRYAGEPYTRGNRYLPGAVELMTSNGQYEPNSNLIYIGAPALNMPMFNTASRATLLGTIGHHIGHELSHAFDTNGALRDATGLAPLYTEEVGKIFMEKAGAISARMNQIELLDGVMLNGELRISELLADITGVSLSLDLAKKTENFDYAEFFLTYASFFSMYTTSRDKLVENYQSMDPHPAPYVRVNFTVSLFDEFYEAFPSVTEGTPMYVAPEDRILVW